MKIDVKSNYTTAAEVAAASYTTVQNGAGVDHASGPSCTFGASATLDAKIQYSDDNTNWTDYPASDPAGNSKSITQMTAAGIARLHVVSPRNGDHFDRVTIKGE